MRKPMTMVLFASGIMFVSAMAEAKIKFERFHREITIEVLTIKEISVIKPKLEAKVKMPVVKNHSTFLDAIGFRESSNNYKAVNQFGYLGKYQFGRKTLNAIGFENISNRE